MKIALAHRRLELRGGTERVLYRTAQGLHDRGHDVHLFCHQFRIPPPHGVVPHRVPGFSKPRSLRALTFAIAAPLSIAKENCDVVMSFDRILSQDIIRSGSGPRKLLLKKMKEEASFARKIWYSLNPYHCLTRWIERLQVSGNRSGKIVTVSEQSGQDFTDLYGIPKEQVLVIHNGVDFARFNPGRRLNQGRKLRESFGIPADAQVVLFVGTGFRRKGLHRLLKLWERNDLPGIYLLVVGNDGRLSKYRRRWAHQKTVIFAGVQANVEDYYACADLFALPAVQEGFGNVILEAMASGLPVVAAARVGASSILSGNLSAGIVSDPGNPAELKAKISHVLDPELWPRLAAEARRIAEKFTWDHYLDRIEQTLYDCAPPSARVRQSA
jgi:UDP-glucose:(heptosyl)LPS alpha-1,3-glucosyltransferase